MKKNPKKILSRLFASVAGGLGAAGSLFAVDETPVVLSPFEVREASEFLYKVSATNTGTIISMPRDQIPFVTTVVTASMIEDLRLLNPSSYATQMAGVSMAQNDQMLNDGAQLGTGTSFKVRGTDTTPLYNGFQTGRGINQSPFSTGRVEVTKGPNSILYGQSSAGGTVNFVPKQATIGAEVGSVTFGVGSNDGYAGNFDVGGGLGSGSTSAVRFGGGYQENTRKQQFYWASQASVYGAYRLYLTKNISLEVNAETLRTKTHPARTAAFVSLGSGTDRVTDAGNRLRKDRNFNYHGPWSYREGTAWISSGYITDVISPNLTARLGGFYARQDQEANSIDGVYGLATGVTATGYYQDSKLNQSMTGFKADLLHQGEMFGYKVSSLLGYEDHLGRDRAEQIRTATNVTVTIPFERKPLASDWPKQPNLSLYTVWSGSTLDRLYWSNYRFTQIVTTPGDNGTFMWGVAKGEGTNKTTDFRVNSASKAIGSDTTFTAGPTYRIFNDSKMSVTLFANYSTSFLIQGGNKQNPSQFNNFPTVAALRAYVDSLAPQSIDPQTGKGYEAGIRASSKDGKFRAELTWFDQTRENIARGFFVRESNVVGQTNEQVIATYQLASGKEQDKGAELTLDWNPTKTFNLFASALLSQGRVTANPESPAEVGFELPNSPQKMFNVWGRYKWDGGDLAGFVVGVGAAYKSDTRTMAALADRFRRSDAYTVGRLLVSYEFGKEKRKHRVTANVENALNQEYVSESGILSEPRIYSLSYTYAW